MHFIPLHLHPYYQQAWGYRPGQFPDAEAAWSQVVSLPLYPAMSDGDVDDVADGRGRRRAQVSPLGAMTMPDVADAALRRLLDVTVAGTLLLVLAPLLGVLALLVRATSPGPAALPADRASAGTAGPSSC